VFDEQHLMREDCTMPEKPKANPRMQKFSELLESAEVFAPPRPAERGPQLVGRVRRSPETGKLVVLAPSPSGVPQVIELAVSDVVDYEQVFEDSAGDKSHRITLTPDAVVKLVIDASALPQLPQTPKPGDPKFDPKGFDPKQADPKFDPKTFDPKQTDPKFDPKNFDPKQADPKQFDPKQTDPKFDPKNFDPKQTDPKQIDPKGNDPKFDPKGFDPKGDPKGDPGPIGPFVLMTRY
jgi:hypothetical protein